MASPACATCAKSAPEVKLKHCLRCPEIKYCGRECQTAHWPVHCSVCGKQPGAASASNSPGTSASSTAKLSPPKGLQRGIAQPFTSLDQGTWLHGRPETDVYAILIDAYRLRVEDMYRIEREVEADSLYSGAASGLAGFRRFLGRVATKPGLLPPWWDASKKQECEALGMDESQWHDLRTAVEKGDIVDYYGDAQFPMQLRMFAEAVYGSAPGGASGAGMRGMLMAMEQGNAGGMHASSMDLSSMFTSARK